MVIHALKKDIDSFRSKPEVEEILEAEYSYRSSPRPFTIYI
jgi:hypothetical protein